MVDAAAGVLGIEWIEGQSVRRLLPGGAEEEGEEEDIHDDLDVDLEDALHEYGITTGN